MFCNGLGSILIGPCDDVVYEKIDDEPGLLVEHSDGTSWSPVRFSWSEVKSASAASSISDLDISECLSIGYSISVV